MISITYRTSDPTQWGAGIGRNLHASEFDQNLWNLATAIVALQTDRPQPNNIASITVTDTVMNITLDDGTVIGPLPLPVLTFRWRAAWAPFTPYAVLDAFTVEGYGLYLVVQHHTSGAEFDPNQTLDDGTTLVLEQMLGSDAGSTAAAAIYDMGFYYQGRIADNLGALIYEVPLLREVLVPASSLHQAYLDTPPSVNAIDLPVLHNGSNMGTIHFDVGANTGAVTVVDNIVLAGERLAVGVPPVNDATAAGLAVSFAAQRLMV